MKVYAPKYYGKFKCIADKCRHSCCVGWEIDLDKCSADKYLSLSNPYAENIIKSINFSDIPHFNLDSNNNCPHLNENGLCNIIINCGDDYLCDICREHPRFYNFTNHGKEVGIGMSCEEVCSLILNCDSFDDIVEISEVDGQLEKYEFDATEYRSRVFKILKDNSLQIDGKIEMICEYFGVPLHHFSFVDTVLNFEYLNEDHKVLFYKATELFWNLDISCELTRILAYYIYRHCSEAYDFDEFLISLSFAIFCTGLISSLSDKNTVSDIARIVSEEIEYSQENTEMIKSLFY